MLPYCTFFPLLLLLGFPLWFSAVWLQCVQQVCFSSYLLCLGLWLVIFHFAKFSAIISLTLSSLSYSLFSHVRQVDMFLSILYYLWMLCFLFPLFYALIQFGRLLLVCTDCVSTMSSPLINPHKKNFYIYCVSHF